MQIIQVINDILDDFIDLNENGAEVPVEQIFSEQTETISEQDTVERTETPSEQVQISAEEAEPLSVQVQTDERKYTAAELKKMIVYSEIMKPKYQDA